MALPLFQTIQRYAPWVVLGVVALMGVIGIVAFYLALRPCVVEVKPGQIVRYEVSKKIFADASEGDEEALLREERSTVSLIMLSADGLSAMLVAPPGARRPDLRFVELKRTGQVLLRSGETSLSHGPKVGYFDFNLMSLPPGLDQAWDAEVHYGYPPSSKRSHSTHIRRTHNGSIPRFSWRLPAIEWVDQTPPELVAVDGQRYVQMQDLVMTYGFDTSRGLWDSARLRFRAGVETPEGLLRHRVEVSLKLREVELLTGEQLREARQAVNRIDRIQSLMASGNVTEARSRIADESRSRIPEITHLLERWRADANAQAGPGDFLIQVATISEQRSEALRWHIIAEGYPAVVLRKKGALAVVYAGPFAEKRSSALADIRRRLRRDYWHNNPFWVQVPWHD